MHSSAWPLSDFRLESYLGTWEFQAEFHLTASDMESWTLQEILDFASPESLAQWHQQSLGYLPSSGSPGLREQIAQTYQSIHEGQVLCFSGAEEGLYCAMHALLGRDDHAIVTTPNYQSMEELPRSLCESVSAWPLRPEHGWEPDLDQLARIWRPNTKVLAVNFPNNPTGKVISQQGWRQLLGFVAERKAWLFSDEVYRGLERDPAHTLDQAADLYERALSLNVMSKAYGLPGLRIGWIACKDQALLGQMESIKHYLSICNSAPSERLATIALQARDHLLGRNRQIVQQNLILLREFLQRHQQHYRWHEPEGGCVGFVQRRKPGGSVDNWCRRLVCDHGVLLLPGSIYRSSLASVPEDHFRIGFGRRNFARGLARLGDLTTAVTEQ